MERTTNPTRKADAANRCGRGMIHFRTLFSHLVIELPTRARVALRAAYGWLSRSARLPTRARVALRAAYGWLSRSASAAPPRFVIFARRVAG